MARLDATTLMIVPVAHLHHAWDIYNRYGRTSAALRFAALQTRESHVTARERLLTDLQSSSCRIRACLASTVRTCFCVRGPCFRRWSRTSSATSWASRSTDSTSGCSPSGGSVSSFHDFIWSISADGEPFINSRCAIVIQLAYLLGIAGYIYTMRWWTQADDSLFWPAPGQPARF